MKKIFTSTIERTANIAVIEINPYLIAKAIRTEFLLQQIALNGRYETKTTDKATGETTTKVHYPSCVGEDTTKRLVEEVLPFISELVAAFEE